MQAVLLAVLLSAGLSAGEPSAAPDPLADAAKQKIEFTPSKTADLSPELAKDESCASIRTWALEQMKLPPFPGAFEDAAGVVTKVQERLVKANRLKLPDLCPVVILPMKSLEAKNLPVTLDDGKTFKFVVLTTGMLRQAANDSQLAFVIGHELAHLVQGSGDVKDLDAFRKRELEADRGGASYLRLAGYEPWEVPRFFDRLTGVDPRYPSSKQRRDALEPYLGLAPASLPRASSESRDKAVSLVDAARVPEP